MESNTGFDFVLHTVCLGAGNSDYDNSCDDTLTSRLSASISLFVARAGAGDG